MKNILFILVIMGIISSCEQRIEMDLGQWGDHAHIDNVQVFKLFTEEAQLSEYYLFGELTPGVQIAYISQGKAVIDSVAFTATVQLRAGENLTEAGIQIWHKADMVEPIGDTPVAGIVTNLTGKELKYRLTSANGVQHDWTITIIE